jgi:hypothetical protein
MILPKHFFSKHQNKAEFKNLDDSEVFSSDFPDLRNLISLIDLWGWGVIKSQTRRQMGLGTYL